MKMANCKSISIAKPHRGDTMVAKENAKTQKPRRGDTRVVEKQMFDVRG
jgi:hypothetical protein